MSTDAEHFRLLGTLSRESDGQRLTAGSLDVALQDGNLRTVRFLGHEVLRAIAFLVRDRDWGTCAPEISGLSIDEAPDHFHLTYRAVFRAPDGANLMADIRIEAWASGILEFVARYVADAAFETARAGFTVLHPLSGVVGQPVEVLHGDGRIETGHWPDLIEPWQPFKHIRAITHTVAPGIKAETLLQGDTFEMEDQRNWTDASFKTYVRPLALPWPYTIPPNVPMMQSVRIRLLRDALARPAERRLGDLRLDRQETDIALPTIGIGLRPECHAQDLSALQTLHAVGAGMLLGHFDPLAGHDLRTLDGYAHLQRASGLPLTLELALPCVRRPEDELREVAAQCAEAGLKLESLFVCPSVDRQSTPPGSRWPDCPPLEDVYAAARMAFGSLRLGGGMMSYFTELNRKRVPAELIDYISHTTNPIVHAADDLSVMQSFEALADVVRSVRVLYPSKPYRIGPSTIAMRQNPYGAATKDNPTLARIPMANVDPRHNGEFGAAWALAYAATVTEARLELLALSTLTGAFGLVAGDGEPMPKGALRPLAHVIAQLGRMAGAPLWRLRSDHAEPVRGLGTARTMVLANITPEVVRVTIGWRFTTVRPLGRPQVLPASGETVELQPYQTVVVD
ncbi:MAG: hypothetical protein P4L82_01695 [Ancalomicrobiaceae bacterium]|nr:hypothetical protein [Ancalomicrobiaceae bacterium]